MSWNGYNCACLPFAISYFCLPNGFYSKLNALWIGFNVDQCRICCRCHCLSSQGSTTMIRWSHDLRALWRWWLVWQAGCKWATGSDQPTWWPWNFSMQPLWILIHFNLKPQGLSFAKHYPCYSCPSSLSGARKVHLRTPHCQILLATALMKQQEPQMWPSGAIQDTNGRTADPS